MITEKDYLNDLELKAIRDPILTEEYKAVINGEPTKNSTAKYFGELIQNGIISKDAGVSFVGRLVSLEENATAQMEGLK